MTKRQPRITPKQEKLISKVIENALEMNNTKTKKELLLEAGYSKVTANESTRILDSETIQREIARRTAETVARMEENRSRMIDRIPKKLNSAPFNHLVNGVDIMTKNIQLLSGKATENKAIHIEISEHVANKNNIGMPDNVV